MKSFGINADVKEINPNLFKIKILDIQNTNPVSIIEEISKKIKKGLFLLFETVKKGFTKNTFVKVNLLEKKTDHLYLTALRTIAVNWFYFTEYGQFMDESGRKNSCLYIVLIRLFTALENLMDEIEDILFYISKLEDYNPILEIIDLNNKFKHDFSKFFNFLIELTKSTLEILDKLPNGDLYYIDSKSSLTDVINAVSKLEFYHFLYNTRSMMSRPPELKNNDSTELNSMEFNTKPQDSISFDSLVNDLKATDEKIVSKTSALNFLRIFTGLRSIIKITRNIRQYLLSFIHGTIVNLEEEKVQESIGEINKNLEKQQEMLEDLERFKINFK